MHIAALCALSASVTVRLVSAQDSGPVIDAVTIRSELQRYEMVYPDFHFHDPSGSVRFIHREVVATDAPKQLRIQDGVIVISPDQQKKGAIYTGGWDCGSESYYVTLQAFVLNLAGLKSNLVQYTIHCNGG
jgi:hypothetical protein